MKFIFRFWFRFLSFSFIGVFKINQAFTNKFFFLCFSFINSPFALIRKNMMRQMQILNMSRTYYLHMMLIFDILKQRKKKKQNKVLNFHQNFKLFNMRLIDLYLIVIMHSGLLENYFDNMNGFKIKNSKENHIYQYHSRQNKKKTI